MMIDTYSLKQDAYQLFSQMEETLFWIVRGSTYKLIVCWFNGISSSSIRERMVGGLTLCIVA
jgi:hypothetical protein